MEQSKDNKKNHKNDEAEEKNPILRDIDIYIKNQELYDEICYDELHFDEEDVDMDSKYKTLRNKYRYLIKTILCRNINDFKANGDNYVPEREKELVKELLIAAIDENKKSNIVKWFNGSVDLSDSNKSVDLFNDIKYIIDGLFEYDLISEVTMNEWLRVMRVSTNYNTASIILDIQEQLAKFQDSSLALNQDIGLGEIIVKNPSNHFSYACKPKEKKIDIRGKTIEELISGISSQKDYLYIIKEVIKALEEAAEKRGIEYIKQYAKNKVLFDLKKADQVEGDGRYESLASEYDVWFKKVHEYLSKNEKVLREIEEETECTGLLDFFDIT